MYLSPCGDPSNVLSMTARLSVPPIQGSGRSLEKCAAGLAIVAEQQMKRGWEP